jgi:hypothetical protein
MRMIAMQRNSVGEIIARTVYDVPEDGKPLLDHWQAAVRALCEEHHVRMLSRPGAGTAIHVEIED